LLPAADIAVKDALIHGFRLVLLYGGLSVWLMALASFVVFGRSYARKRSGEANGAAECVAGSSS
jgi:hypothetical protein